LMHMMSDGRDGDSAAGKRGDQPLDQRGLAGPARPHDADHRGPAPWTEWERVARDQVDGNLRAPSQLRCVRVHDDERIRVAGRAERGGALHSQGRHPHPVRTEDGQAPEIAPPPGLYLQRYRTFNYSNRDADSNNGCLPAGRCNACP